MNKIKKDLLKKIKNILFIIQIILIMLYLILIYLTKNYAINITPSLPIGIYRIYKIKNIDEIKKGEIVIYKIPKEFQEFSILKGTEIDSMKKVVAVYGDNIEIKDNKIYVNNENFGDINQNKKLPKFNGKLKENEVLTLSKMKYSFDGRYYGGIDKNKIKERAKLIYEFKRR